MHELGDRIRSRLELRPGADAAAASALLNHQLDPRELRRMTCGARLVPRGAPDARLLDIGASVFWIPVYLDIGYRDITVLQRVQGGGGFFDMWRIAGEAVGWRLEMFDGDAELERYPIADADIDVVTCFELLEHFAGDPMHCLAEANRVLRHQGTLCLTTPNVATYDNLLNLSLGGHPYSWSVFTDSYADRHNREYTPAEVGKLAVAAGFDVEELKTVSPYGDLSRSRRLTAALLATPAAALRRMPLSMRGEQVVLRARKVTGVRERYPPFLYELYGNDRVSVTPLAERGSS